jgi:hypothetical protein
MERQKINLMTSLLPSTAPSTNLTHMTPVNVSHDLRQTNKNNQEVNVITPLPDNFCYETAASKKSLLIQSMLDLMTSSSQTITMGTYNHQLKMLM